MRNPSFLQIKLFGFVENAVIQVFPISKGILNDPIVLVNYSHSIEVTQLIYVTFRLWSTIISVVNFLTRLWSIVRVLLPLGLIMLLSVSSGWSILNQQLYTARQAIETNDHWQASLAFSKAAEQAPWRNDLWENAGIFALQAGKPQTAKSFLERVEQSSQISPAGLMALGDAEQFEGDLQTAIQHWAIALAAGESGELRSRLASAYYQVGDLENAILHQKALAELDPTDSSINYRLGLMLAANQPEASLAYLRLATELDPQLSPKTNALIRNIRSAQISADPAHLFVAAGQSLASIDEWSLAETALTRATQLNPNFADAWAYLGETRQRTGQDGLEQLETALRIDPNSLAANTLMGIFWQRQDRYDLALIYFHSAANLDQHNPAIQVDIGNTLALLGNIQAAESHYRRAVELAPHASTYWRILANFYIKYETKLREEGLAAARQAVILDSDDPASLDAMAQIYLLLDSPLIARRFLVRALAADGEFAPAHLHMGLIHILEGDSLQAYQQFSLAKSLSVSDSPTAQQAKRLLETYFP
jgi:tetratricopeptide (TPR) repeat protein